MPYTGLAALLSLVGDLFTLKYFKNLSSVGLYNLIESHLQSSSLPEERKVIELLEKGADIDYKKDDHYPLFMKAIFFKNAQLAKFLLKHGANVNSRTFNGENVLMRLFAGAFSFREENLFIAKFLIENGLDINAQDDNGCTVLMREVAFASPCIQNIIFLLENGADIHVKNKAGRDAIAICDPVLGDEAKDILMAYQPIRACEGLYFVRKNKNGSPEVGSVFPYEIVKKIMFKLADDVPEDKKQEFFACAEKQIEERLRLYTREKPGVKPAEAEIVTGGLDRRAAAAQA